MCGIVGIIKSPQSAPIDVGDLNTMTDAMSHRGPDGRGTWTNGRVGLGHRRLSILDLSDHGAQPMLSMCGRYIIAFNGELYNYKDIKKDLVKLGCEFRSRTDTEVVLNALKFWGVKAISKFNGMFAFGFWDNEAKTMILARDRYGIKPLYIASTAGQLLFASEIRSITANSDFDKKLDLEGLYEYLTFQNILTHKTLVKNVSIVPAGNYLTFRYGETDVTDLKFQQYWDYKFEAKNQKHSGLELREELERLFEQAVQRQMNSDVEIGAYLSGGMDSGSIVAVAAKMNPGLKTFTCGFDMTSASGLELSFDERETAEVLSARYKTEQYEMVLKSGDMERVLPALAWHLEEPRVGQSYPNFCIAQLASKFVKVVFSGAGGDELFGGYPWRYYRPASNKNFDTFAREYYQFWQRLTTAQERKLIFSPIRSQVNQIEPQEIFNTILKKSRTDDDSPTGRINSCLYFEAKTFLHGLLVVEDKLSMAHSLETRVPFLDNDLVDFSMECPLGEKLNSLNDIINIDENELAAKHRKLFEKTSDGKQILRDVMSKYIPTEITKAPKQGFSSPDASWYKGESIDFVRSKVMNKNAPIYDIIDFKSTTDILNQHLSGKKNRRLFVWSILNLNEYIDNF